MDGNAVGILVVLGIMIIAVIVIGVWHEDEINERLDGDRRRHQARPHDKGW